MVLQRERPIPVWGWASPGEEVVVTLAGEKARGIAGEDGKWQVALASLKAGGPFEMGVQGQGSSTVLKDVMVVPRCGSRRGNRNMDWPLSGALDPEQEIAGATFKKHPLVHGRASGGRGRA